MMLIFLDRSETALFLVEEGAHVGVSDASGLPALTLMVEKMPPVAKIALNQYHRTDRANRKQYFSLNLLEPMRPGEVNVIAKTPMQVTRCLRLNIYLFIINVYTGYTFQKYSALQLRPV